MYTRIAVLLVLAFAVLGLAYGKNTPAQQPSLFIATMLLCQKGFCTPFIDQSGQAFKTHEECMKYNKGEMDLAFEKVPNAQVSISCVEFKAPQGRGIES